MSLLDITIVAVALVLVSCLAIGFGLSVPIRQSALAKAAKELREARAEVLRAEMFAAAISPKLEVRYRIALRRLEGARNAEYFARKRLLAIALGNSPGLSTGPTGVRGEENSHA